jgi:hypothetical protein
MRLYQNDLRTHAGQTKSKHQRASGDDPSDPYAFGERGLGDSFRNFWIFAGTRKFLTAQ